MMNIRDNTALPHNKKKQYNLIPLEDTSKFLSSAYLCVKDFFKILRSSPELMYKILTKAVYIPKLSVVLRQLLRQHWRGSFCNICCAL